jgi:hypothetical protein
MENGNDVTLEAGTGITLSESGSTITIASSVTEVDGDTTNEIQTLSFSNDTLYLTDGGSVDLSTLNATEVDGDTTNEIQTLSFSNDTLYLTDGGNVDLSTLSATEVDGDTTNEIQRIDTLALQGDTLLQISLEGDGEAAKTINLSALNSDDWKVDGNSGTTAGTNFLGTTDAQDLVFKTNNQERLRIKEGDSARVLLANPGDFAFPGLSSSAVIGIDGTNHSRLRLTAGDDETYSDAKGASIDLHGNTSSANTGVLDLVAGSAADSSKAAIKFWTNTDGSSQQTSAVITGEGNMGIGTTSPTEKLDVDGGARVRNLPVGSATDSIVVADATGVLKKVAQGSSTHKIQTLTNTGAVNDDTDVLLVTPGANMTVTIPAIGTGTGEFPEGYELKIKRTNAAGNNITLDPSGTQTIDGQATRTLNIGYQSMTLVATSSGWFIID